MTSLPTFDQVFKPPKTSLKRENNQTENDTEPGSRLETYLQKCRDDYHEHYKTFEKEIAKWFAKNEFERGKAYRLKIHDNSNNDMSHMALDDIVSEMRKKGHCVANSGRRTEFDSDGYTLWRGFVLTFGAAE